MVPGILYAVGGVRMLAFEKTIFKREMNTNISVTAYFLGKVTFQFVFDIIWQPLAYVLIYYFQTTPLSPNFVSDYWVFLLVSWWCTGLGMLLGLTLDYTAAMLNAVIVPLILGTMLAGVMPTTSKMIDMGLEVLTWLTNWFSMSRYMIENRILNEYSALPRHIQEQVGDNFLAEYSYECRGSADADTNQRLCDTTLFNNFFMVFFWGFAFRVFTWLYLLKMESGGWQEMAKRNFCPCLDGGAQQEEDSKQGPVKSASPKEVSTQKVQSDDSQKSETPAEL